MMLGTMESGDRAPGRPRLRRRRPKGPVGAEPGGGGGPGRVDPVAEAVLRRRRARWRRSWRTGFGPGGGVGGGGFGGGAFTGPARLPGRSGRHQAHPRPEEKRSKALKDKALVKKKRQTPTDAPSERGNNAGGGQRGAAGGAANADDEWYRRRWRNGWWHGGEWRRFAALLVAVESAGNGLVTWRCEQQ